MPARMTQIALEVVRRASRGAYMTQLGVEVLRTGWHGARMTQLAVEVVRKNSRGAYMTQLAVEVLRQNWVGARMTQLAVEVLRIEQRGARMTQLAVEVLRTEQHGAHMTQLAVEVLRSYPDYGARMTQLGLEVVRTTTRGAYCTQLALEVLRMGPQYGARMTQLGLEVLRTNGVGARMTQIAVEVLRENANAAVMTQVVGEVLRVNKPIGQYAVAAQPWPFPANAAHDFVEEYGYLSEVLRAQSGTEQRRLLRASPSGRVSFTCTLTTERELQYAAGLFGTLIGTAIGVPLWVYKQALASDHTAGLTEVFVDTSAVPFYAGGLAMLWGSPFNWELVLVYEVHANRIALSEPLQKTWLAQRTAIMPAVVGYLREREEQGKFSPSLGDHDLTFNVPAFSP